MPLRNETPTLEHHAMSCIARHFDHICYGATTRGQMVKLIESEAYLGIDGPFKHLPSVLLTRLLDTMREEGNLRRQHLHLLLQPHLDALNLLGAGASELGFLMVLERCKRLKKLDVCYLRSVGPVTLLRLVPNLTSIVTLNLSNTETVDQVLEQIGQYCPEIRELDISHTPITDRGLPRLCYDTETDKPLCQKLVKLNINGCMITAQPVAFLLQYIPTLRELDYDNIFEVFGVMRGWGLNEDNLATCERLHLRMLNSANVHVDDRDLDTAIALCPHATNFTIANAFIPNEYLYKVMRLENLTHLRITNSDGLTLDFSEGVLPVLTVKGQQLHSLLLVNFTNVDVAAIGECCPSLQNLALSNIGFYEEIMYARENYFTRLRNLEIWTALTVETMTSVILRQLLTYSRGIQNVLIKGTDAISDKLLYDIWRENPMPQLSRLTIDTCPNVTAEAIHQLLDMTNQLTLVRLWGCFFISKADEARLQKRIKKENCDVYLEWFCYEG